MKILFLGSKKHLICKEVLKFLKKKKFKVFSFLRPLTKKDEISLSKKKFDYLISFLYTKIIPNQILKNTNIYNVNFHPGPPKYPGYGCYNYALLNEDKNYACTVHLMNSQFDNGKIIDVESFPITKKLTLENLIKKTHKRLFFLLKKNLKKGFKTSANNYKWSKKYNTREEFEKKREVKPNISLINLKKKLRAFQYKDYPSLYVKIRGVKFEKK